MIIMGYDSETTGFSQPDGHRFVEVCFRGYDLATRDCKISYKQRINPMRTIPAASYNVHGISAADVAGMPTWEVAAPKVIEVINQADILVAHNGDEFDAPFFRGEFKRVGLVMPEKPQIDTMKGARWATPNGKLPNLGELTFACDVEYDEKKAHGAEYDVDVMMQAFFKAYDLGYFKIPGVA